MTAVLLALAGIALFIAGWQLGTADVLALRAEVQQLNRDRDLAIRAAADAQRRAEIHHENASFHRTEATRVLRLAPNNPGA